MLQESPTLLVSRVASSGLGVIKSAVPIVVVRCWCRIRRLADNHLFPDDEQKTPDRFLHGGKVYVKLGEAKDSRRVVVDDGCEAFRTDILYVVVEESGINGDFHEKHH